MKIKEGFCHCGCGRKTGIAKLSYKRYGWIKGKAFNYLRGHCNRKKTPEYIISKNGCWEWQHYISEQGYGNYHGKNNKNIRAHRLYYERYKGKILPNMTIDHLCRNRACVNPEHLEAVTCAENVRRGDRTKLTAEIVKQIHCNQKMKSDELAKMFSVSRQAIDHVRRGSSWREFYVPMVKPTKETRVRYDSIENRRTDRTVV